MTDDILRSGTPHRVETSEITRHAINPRNTFLDLPAQAPAQDEAAPIEPRNLGQGVEVHASAAPPAQEPTLTPEQQAQILRTRAKLAQAKAHLRDNLQTLQNLQTTESIPMAANAAAPQELHDNEVGGSKTHLQDRLFAESKAHPQDRYFAEPKAQLQDSLTRQGSEALQSKTHREGAEHLQARWQHESAERLRRQTVGETKPVLEDRHAREAKQHWVDNRQRVDLTPIRRAAPEGFGPGAVHTEVGETSTHQGPSPRAEGAPSDVQGVQPARVERRRRPRTPAEEAAWRARLEALKQQVEAVDDTLDEMEEEPLDPEDEPPQSGSSQDSSG